MFIEGRVAKQEGGVASFMTAASEAYRELDNSSKQELVQEGKELMLTAADVIKRGAKLFDKIQKLVSIENVEACT